MLINNPSVAQVKVVVKAADQVVNNSVVFVDDNELLLAVEPHDIWLIEMIMFVQSPTNTPDIKYNFTVPVAAVMRGITAWVTGQASSFLDATADDLVAGVDVAVKSLTARFTYVGGVNGGVVQFRWAQNIATAEDTKIMAYSTMRCIKA